MSGITCGLYSRAMAPHHPGGLTREHVVWAYRLLLDRDPENEDVIGPKLAGSRDTSELRRHLMTSAEFLDKNPDFARTNDSTVVIKEIAPGVRLFLDLSDHVIGLNILRGGYERDEIAFVRRALEPGDVAIDALDLRRPVRLVKMDVEGAEPLVVRGAARVLKEDRPTILSELHPTQLDRASGTTADAFLGEMRALGYRAHAIDRGSLGAPLDRAPADALVSVAFVPE